MDSDSISDSDFSVSFQHSLSYESWPLYAVGILVIILRMYARIRWLGFRGLQLDDYLMLVAGAFYTILITSFNIITRGGSNLFPPEDFPTFTQTQIENRIKGSKVVILSEQAFLNLIYSIKFCMLVMYSRLTAGLGQHLAVKALAGYVALGWVATQLSFFFACRPFKGYWAVPPPDPQCATFKYYGITQAVFNLSSDVSMLAIFLPLLLSLPISVTQRLILCGVFGMGVFIIIADILTNVFNFMDVYDPSYLLWYTRESSTAIYVSNIPAIWPLFRESFPCFRINEDEQDTSFVTNISSNAGTASCSHSHVEPQMLMSDSYALESVVLG